MTRPLKSAACPLCKLGGRPDNAEMNGLTLWQDYLSNARAVLLPVQQPSDAMLAIAGALPCSAGTTACWQAMIDAALSE